jgi:hypothetical protein
MIHIKQAGAVEDALRAIGDKMELHKHPFETIFSTAVPMIIWPASKLLSSFMFIADAIGYGPSKIGEYIDKKLGFYSGSPDLSDSNIRNTASSFVDDMLSMIGMQIESDMDIFLKKESLLLEDLVSIAALIKNKSLQKQAGPGRASLLKRFIQKVFKGQRLGLMNFLYFLIKTFVKGLIGIGIATGIVSKTKEVMFDETSNNVPKDNSVKLKLLNPSDSLMSGELIPYSNVFGNVEESLIEHLKDIKINYEGEKFSLPEYFEKEKSRPLKGSPEMKKLFKDKIFPYNQVLNDPVFIAPKLQDLGKSILPHIVIANLIGNVKRIYK